MARLAVTPDQIGLCGCWQIIAVERKVLDLRKPNEPPSMEIGYYVTSLTVDEYSPEEIEEMIRQHWSAIENGTHHRRDVTLGEDACRTTERQAAPALASLRNLVIGAFEIERERGRTKATTCKSWCQQQTFSTAHRILKR